MDRLSQVLTLDLLPGVGCYRLRQRLNGLSPFDLFECSASQLAGLGFNAQQRKVIAAPCVQKLDRAKNWLAAHDKRKIISYFDPGYPALLKEIAAPPLLLFCQGHCELLSQPQIAMVGSRVPTIAGRENAKRLARHLAEFDLTITSGLATGIDSCAHLGAISANGMTIAVLGSGLNNIYPKANIGLANKITEQGLLASEFWPDVLPNAPHFPRRNRIISGMALGVVVVEAAEKSGSLITARLAVEQNREVFAVPGSINNPKVKGCHKLINQGAKLVTGVADIIEELPSDIIAKAVQQHKTPSRFSPQLPFDIILDSVGYETTPVDQVVEQSNMPIDMVLEHLLALELAGLIVLGSGGYTRITGDT